MPMSLLDIVAQETALDRRRNAVERIRVESILYIGNRLSDPGMHNTFKMMYFADKYHLEKYGRLIFDDDYIAMKDGPVPSETFNLAKQVRRGYFSFLPFDIHDRYHISVNRDADRSVFSESEIEALDFAIKKYGRLSFNQLSKKSHDKSYEAADLNNAIPIEALTLDMENREVLMEHLADPYP